jgi:hypothetical protein
MALLLRLADDIYHFIGLQLVDMSGYVLPCLAEKLASLTTHQTWAATNVFAVPMLHQFPQWQNLKSTQLTLHPHLCLLAVLVLKAQHWLPGTLNTVGLPHTHIWKLWFVCSITCQHTNKQLLKIFYFVFNLKFLHCYKCHRQTQLEPCSSYNMCWLWSFHLYLDLPPIQFLWEGHVMAQAVSHRSVYVGFVMDKEAVRQTFLTELWFSHQCHSTMLYIQSFIRLSPMLHNCRNWQQCSMMKFEFLWEFGNKIICTTKLSYMLCLPHHILYSLDPANKTE